jgi:hypothetical protein
MHRFSSIWIITCSMCGILTPTDADCTKATELLVCKGVDASYQWCIDHAERLNTSSIYKYICT